MEPLVTLSGGGEEGEKLWSPGIAYSSSLTVE